MTEKARLEGASMMEKNLVAWHSKKQNSQSLSTCEAEYIAAGTCCTNSYG